MKEITLAGTEFKGLVESKGGLFDMSNSSNPEMEANIGRECVYHTPTCGIERETVFTIECLQKNYKGDTIYRLTYEGDTFGHPASPDKLKFI